MARGIIVMLKEKIIHILTNSLSYVYCDNCANNIDDDLCKNCHRKYMNWELNADYADTIADKILECIDLKFGEVGIR